MVICFLYFSGPLYTGPQQLGPVSFLWSQSQLTILPDLMGHDFKSQVPGLVGNQGVSSSVGSRANVFMSHDLQARFDSTQAGEMSPQTQEASEQSCSLQDKNTQHNLLPHTIFQISTEKVAFNSGYIQPNTKMSELLTKELELQI